MTRCASLFSDIPLVSSPLPGWVNISVKVLIKKKFKNICLLAFVPVSESVEDAVMILIKVSLTGVLNF